MATTAVLNLGINTKQFSNGLKSASSQLTSFSKWAVGGLAVAGGVAVAGLGAISYQMLKLGSDAEETENKFNEVFSSIGKDANDISKNLAKNYGLSQRESQKLLSDTGDLLTGFGFTQKASLDLSKQVQELAVDLSSFQNFAGGAEGASIALTKALLGESEQAKALGIVLRQDSDEYKKSVEQKQKDLNISLLQAKALTALEIARKQSKNAIGDYARTEKQLANQLRLTSAIWDDLTVGVSRFFVEFSGAKGIVLGFNETFRQLTDNILGFLSNWQENFKTFTDWFLKNWETILLVDLPNLFGTLIKNTLINFGQLGRGLAIIWLAIGEDISQSVAGGFADGLKLAFKGFGLFASKVSEGIKLSFSGDFTDFLPLITKKLSQGLGALTGSGQKTLGEKVAMATKNALKVVDFKSLTEGFESQTDDLEFNLKINDKFSEDLNRAKQELEKSSGFDAKTTRTNQIQDAFEKGSIEAFKKEKQTDKTQKKIEKWTRETAENTKNAGSASITVNQQTIAG